MGLILFGQRHDEIVDLGVFGRLLNLGTCGVIAAIGDVVIDRVVKQNRILRHHADCAMQAGLGDIAQVLIINVKAALTHIIKTEQQPPNRGFP